MTDEEAKAIFFDASRHASLTDAEVAAVNDWCLRTLNVYWGYYLLRQEVKGLGWPEVIEPEVGAR